MADFERTTQLYISKEQDSLKYLELTLDMGLTWEKQLDIVTNKTHRAFYTCRVMFGGIRGL
jgi:hypothetical protein